MLIQRRLEEAVAAHVAAQQQQGGRGRRHHGLPVEVLARHGSEVDVLPSLNLQKKQNRRERHKRPAPWKSVPTFSERETDRLHPRSPVGSAPPDRFQDMSINTHLVLGVPQTAIKRSAALKSLLSLFDALDH